MNKWLDRKKDGWMDKGERWINEGINREMNKKNKEMTMDQYFT